MFSGFARALARDPESVLLIRPGTTYKLNGQSRHNRSAILAYYREKGHAVLEFPVTKRYNVTVVAPASLTPHILDFIDGMSDPGSVNFNCTGLPGCRADRNNVTDAAGPLPDKDEL
jgi:hypothetical protein